MQEKEENKEAFGAESNHPVTHSQFTACDGLGNQLEVVGYEKKFPVTYGIDLITRHKLLFRGSRATVYQR